MSDDFFEVFAVNLPSIWFVISEYVTLSSAKIHKYFYIGLVLMAFFVSLQSVITKNKMTYEM
jgi:hypothetical protein